jgi:outer membrane murein-binding lipoprotein Lpp
MSMKALLAAALFSLLALAGCDDRQVSDLDQRVRTLEKSVQQMQASQKEIADDAAKVRTHLQVCIFEANSKFQESLEGNGTKRRDGSYDVPIPIMAEMERQKRDKIEECKVLYGK